MNLKIIEATYNGRTFRIEEDYPEIGVYLYVFENKKCIKDFLQNSIKDCKEIAYELYGVNDDYWIEIAN